MATLPASGAISFSQLRTVMGGSGAVTASSYRADSSTYFTRGVTGIPTSGSLSVSVFAGKSRAMLPGLVFRIFSGYFADDPLFFERNTETNTGATSDFSSISTATNGIKTVDGSDNYSVEWYGYFYATATGIWTFYTTSDDASYLWIGSTATSGYTTGNAIVNNGGTHAMQERSGSISLTAGTYYPIRIQFGEAGGGDNIQVSFTPPGGSRTYNGAGYYFYGLGTNSAYAAQSARIIKSLTSTNVNAAYYIMLNGTSTLTYCLMDSVWNGGGWMMVLKASRGTTFPFSSTYWTDNSTLLNTSDATRNDGNSKFQAYNFAMVKDVMALWPDVGYTGGSIAQSDSWCWLVNNFYNSGARATMITGLAAANSRDSPTNPDPSTFAGFSTSIWSSQTPSKRHVFGGGGHIAGGVNLNVRWGFLWNENALGDFTSCDASGGIGMSAGSYSGGDLYSCCGSIGLNRTMRYELYAR